MSANKKVSVKLMLAADDKAQSPVGAALGQKAISQKAFRDAYAVELKKYNVDKSVIVNLDVILDSNKNLIVSIKGPSASSLIKNVLNLKSGSANPKKQIVGTLSEDQLNAIANAKLQFSNNTLESIKKQIVGTAKNMGVLYEKTI